MKARSLPKALQGLRLPAVAAPLFIVSCPKLVIAQCKAGIVGSFPALNARDEPGGPVVLEAWLKEITEALDRHVQAMLAFSRRCSFERTLTCWIRRALRSSSIRR